LDDVYQNQKIVIETVPLTILISLFLLVRYVQEVGYNHGKTYFDGMLRGSQFGPKGSAPLVNPQQILQRVASNRNLSSLGRSLSGSYNFTDLAQLVCKVRSNYSADEYSGDEETDEEIETGYISEPSADILRITAKVRHVRLLLNVMSSHASYGF